MCLVLAGPARAGLPLEKILGSTDPVPGAPGLFFSGGGVTPQVAVSGTGDIVIFADYGSGARGLFRQNGDGPLETLLLTGDAAPTPAGALFGSTLQDLSLDDEGDIAFLGFLQQGPGGVTGDDDLAVWSLTRAGSLALIAREGDTAPGTSSSFPQGTDSNLWPVPQALDGLRTGVRWRIGTGIADRRGAWLGDPALDTLLLIENTPAPTPIVNATLNGLEALGFSADGDLTARIRINGTGPPKALVATVAGQLETVAYGGKSVLGTQGVTYGSQFYRGPRTDRDGRTAFNSKLNGTGSNGTDSAIWVLDDPGDGHSLVAVAQEGWPASADVPGAVFDSVGDSGDELVWVFGEDGEAVFVAKLRPGVGDVDAADDLGLWAWEDGAVHLVVREGDPAPGLPAGTTYASFFAEGLDRNGEGEMVFLAGLAGPDVLPAQNDAALFVVDRYGNPHLVARKGDAVELIGANTITGFLLPGDAARHLPRRSLGDAGELVFSVRLDNDKVAVVRVGVPGAPAPVPLGGAVGGTLVMVMITGLGVRRLHVQRHALSHARRHDRSHDRRHARGRA